MEIFCLVSCLWEFLVKYIIIIIIIAYIFR